MDRNCKAPAQLLSELRHFLRLPPFLAAHAQGISQHDLCNLLLAKNTFQPGKVTAFVPALKSLQSLGGDAQRV